MRFGRGIFPGDNRSKVIQIDVFKCKEGFLDRLKAVARKNTESNPAFLQCPQTGFRACVGPRLGRGLQFMADQHLPEGILLMRGLLLNEFQDGFVQRASQRLLDSRKIECPGEGQGPVKIEQDPAYVRMKPQSVNPLLFLFIPLFDQLDKALQVFL